MHLFDPRKADMNTLENREDRSKPPSVFGSLRRRGGVGWNEKGKDWWAGVTIAFPHTHAALQADKIKKQVLELAKRAEKGDEDAVGELNDLYLKETEAFRNDVRSVLGNREVLFENNATTALMLARALSGVRKGVIVTTEDLPQTLYWTMRGGDPHKTQKQRLVAKRDLLLPPSLGFFSTHSQIQPGGEKSKIALKKIPLYDASRPMGRQEILDNLESAITNDKVRMVVLPHVSRTGQILPITEARGLIDKENAKRNADEKILFVVDAAQSIGRVPLEEIRKAHEVSDFFLFTTAKALGGLLGSAVVTAKRRLVTDGIHHLLKSRFSKYVKAYQFPPGYSGVYEFMNERGFHTAVSLPELAAGRVGFNARYGAPEERLLAEDEKTLEEVEEKRGKVIKALGQIPNIELIEPRWDAPFAPSIIPFRLRNTNVKPEELKLALQTNDAEYGIITPSALVENGVLRLEIPTYREMPSIEKLVGKIKAALGA